MPQRPLDKSVFDATLDRLIEVYEAGHRVVVSFSAGKDSGICLEMCILAATATGRLPVEVAMRDEEIMYPGTFEYAERCAARPEIEFHWLIAGQPIVNIFNRNQPYWWVFDPLAEDKWVRRPPEFAKYIPEKNITQFINTNRFPPAEGKELMSVIGLRTQESMNRKMGLMSSGGYLTKPNNAGVVGCRPIYDWSDGDVWKAIADSKWDYNEAYDVMLRLGVPRRAMRIAPPTLSAASIEHLGMAAKAWPRWFDLVCKRLEGIRTAAMYGRRAVEPNRRDNESWQECYERTCITEAPAWIAERAIEARRVKLERHHAHSSVPFPQIELCPKCYANGSWKALTRSMYMGDPFAMKNKDLTYVEPEFFRAGAGTWGGSPSW